MLDVNKGLKKAVRHFWKTRDAQSQRQGATAGQRDQGDRSAVTGGAQMQGFVNLVREILVEYGVPRSSIYCEKDVQLPGWFRPEKKWDVLVKVDDCLIASVEFKSQVGSFGNNFNNRTEEALGNATDIWAAYREGAFRPSSKPWLGYLMLMEEAPKSTTPIRASEPHFEVFPEFKQTSYLRRYEILLTKLLRERLYDGTCLLTSDRVHGPKGKYREPNAELCFRNFIQSLVARALACIKGPA